MRIGSKLIIFCLVCLSSLRLSAQDGRNALFSLPPFERAVLCIKHFESLHSWKDYPYVGYGHQLLARRAVHGGDDGTAGGLPASNRPDETSDDVQGLRQGCFAACRPVLQCRDGQIAGIWETPQEQTTAEDRVGRQEFLP